MNTKQLVAQTKMNAACNTIISLLFLVLIALFALFVCDMTGYVRLDKPLLYMEQAPADLPFISAAQQSDNALVGQEAHHSKNQRQITKPLIDHRHYRYIELPNKLKVLLIQDSQTQMSTAALDVKVGSWDEPNEFAGLAHFCEHMLFIGSQKYPKMGYFDDLMASGAGYSNAYTESTNTNYYFEVTQEHFEKSLDAFAHFFIDPLFSQEAVSKEVNAVNSEYEIDVNSEDWKIVNLFSLLADSNHPASRFSIGNNEVLSKEGVVDALKQFYADKYSSNLMALAVQSSMGLEHMEKIIRKGAFSKIPNKNHQAPEFKGHPYKMGQLGKYKAEKRVVILNWQLSGRGQYEHSKPLELIDYFISSSHTGGLKDYILSNKLAIQLESSVFIEETDFVNYIVELTLPDQKIADRSVALEIAQICMNYLETLQEWMKDEKYFNEIYQEQSQLSKINFEYMEGPQEISALSKNLNKYAPEEVLSATFILDQLDKEPITKYLEELKQVSNLLILIGDEDLEYKDEQSKEQDDKQFLQNNIVNTQSTIYRLDYAVRSMSKESEKQISKQDKQIKKQFKRPPQNDFIPNDLSLVQLCDGNHQLPQLIHSDQLESLDIDNRIKMFMAAGQNLQSYGTDECLKEEKSYEKNNHYPILLSDQQWWKVDTHFKLPTVYSALQYHYTHYPNVKEYTALKIFNLYTDDQLKEQLAQPLNSGYNFELNLHYSLELKVYGFSEKVRNFFNKICSCLNPFREKSSFLQVDDSLRFDRAKEALISQIKDQFQMKLYEQAIGIHLHQVFDPQYHSPTDLMDQLDSINQDDMFNAARNILNGGQQTTFVAGNINYQDAKDISTDLQECVVDKQNTNKDFIKLKQQVMDIRGKSIQYTQFVQFDQGDLNGATLNYYQIGVRTRQNYAIMKLLQGTINNKAYGYLRTDLQLGYVVAMKFKPIGCIDGALFLVQGSKEVPHQVDMHIEEFLLQFKETLNKMGKKEFEHIKSSAITELREKSKTLTDEGEQLWSYISQGDLLFEEKHLAMEDIKHLKKESVIQFYENTFITNKSKISIQLYGEGMVTETLKLKDEQAFNDYVKQNKHDNGDIVAKDRKYFECSNDVSSI